MRKGHKLKQSAATATLLAEVYVFGLQGWKLYNIYV